MTTQLPSIPDWSVRAVFRKNVKELRKEARNLTQQALADRLEELDWQGHMSSATVAKIEKGERQVKIEEAIMIAQALRVGLVDLLRPPPGQSIAIGRWLHPGITRQVCGEAPWTKGFEPGRLPDEDEHWPDIWLVLFSSLLGRARRSMEARRRPERNSRHIRHVRPRGQYA